MQSYASEHPEWHKVRDPATAHRRPRAALKIKSNPHSAQFTRVSERATHLVNTPWKERHILRSGFSTRARRVMKQALVKHNDTYNRHYPVTEGIKAYQCCSLAAHLAVALAGTLRRLVSGKKARALAPFGIDPISTTALNCIQPFTTR